MTKQTPKGALSLDEEVLLGLAAHPGSEISQLADAVLRIRKYTKLSSTYLDHFLENHVDGRIHGSINPLGAKTGRMAIQNPPLQTLPRADEGNPAAIAIRNCFVPSEGNRLLMADFDQVELRLMAHFSQDPTMLEVLSGTNDPFTEFARRIYDDPTLEKKDPRRQLTKNASYAKAYGAGPEKFSATAGVSLEQGRAFLEIFDQTFPGVRRFQTFVQQKAEERMRAVGEAYVMTPAGRRLKCEDDKFYKLVNYLIQGTAADVLKQKLVELDMAGLGEFLILPVHDEVILDVPEDKVAEVAREVEHIMTERHEFAVALPVGVEGPYERWGQKYGG
jgi:DNA polymerase-1